ncbi:MAG TPA: ferrous iron transport protein B [Tissierellales bacterium]|nr:ferrous iron transport protein B [Tissierellales bacterium]
MSTIALAGNPNSGKTTVFNALTGTNQHVGNWPGVTVEKKEGRLKYNSKEYIIVDLPGTYSLGANSEDEVVARDFILKENPDVIINVVDATNIERNLYLTTQLLEMGAKVIVALNMMDEAKKNNIHIDIDKLSKKLGTPVVETIASKGEGMEELIQKSIHITKVEKSCKTNISYGNNIDREVQVLKDNLEKKYSTSKYPSDWIAIKLLEGDEYVFNTVGIDKDQNFSKLIKNSVDSITNSSIEPELAILDSRYKFINSIIKESVSKPNTTEETTSDRIDKVLTNKWLGIPIFALIMFVMFQATFTIGEDLLGEFVAGGIESLGEFIGVFLTNVNAPAWLIAFISDGLFQGVGAVLEFIPLIFVLYTFMGILEDSGYMARAAYIMDRLMRALGLHGKTFVSMLVGFGCNVPGIMSTRTLENKKDRMIAILINPFMSCGAKLPIYLMFIAAFFPEHGGIVLFSIYALGIIIALLMGKLFSKTLFKDEPSYFIMELPPYRIPTFKGVMRNAWEKVSSFIKRAGTIIFGEVTILWILAVLPLGVEPYSQGSILGKIGTFVSPIFKPAGFGNWEASVGLFAGIVAKEAVVATLGMVHAGVDNGTKLVIALQQAFTPLSAISFMVMTLLYTPCAATLGTIKRETNSVKWTLFIALYTFLIGWVSATLIYQIGGLLGFS